MPRKAQPKTDAVKTETPVEAKPTEADPRGELRTFGPITVFFKG